MENLFLVILVFMLMLLPILAALGVIVLGIITGAGKTESVRMLGMSFIFASIGTLTTGLLQFFAHLLPMEQYVSLSQANIIVTEAGSFISLIFVCIFLHKNYGKKNIYVPLLLIQLAGSVIPRITAYFINKLPELKGIDLTVALMMNNLTGYLVTEIAVSLIIIITLFKNRKVEKVVPKLWVLKIITLAFAFISFGTNSFLYLNLLNDPYFLTSYDWMSSVITLAGSLLILLIPVYVTVKAVKTAKTKDLPEAV